MLHYKTSVFYCADKSWESDQDKYQQRNGLKASRKSAQKRPTEWTETEAVKDLLNNYAIKDIMGALLNKCRPKWLTFEKNSSN